MVASVAFQPIIEGALTCVSPDGAYVASIANFVVLTIRSTDSLAVIQKFTTLDEVTAIGWAPTSGYVACVMEKRGVVEVVSVGRRSFQQVVQKRGPSTSTGSGLYSDIPVARIDCGLNSVITCVWHPTLPFLGVVGQCRTTWWSLCDTSSAVHMEPMVEVTSERIPLLRFVESPARCAGGRHADDSTNDGQHNTSDCFAAFVSTSRTIEVCCGTTFVNLQSISLPGSMYPTQFLVLSGGSLYSSPALYFVVTDGHPLAPAGAIVLDLHGNAVKTIQQVQSTQAVPQQPVESIVGGSSSPRDDSVGPVMELHPRCVFDDNGNSRSDTASSPCCVCSTPDGGAVMVVAPYHEDATDGNTANRSQVASNTLVASFYGVTKHSSVVKYASILLSLEVSAQFNGAHVLVEDTPAVLGRVDGNTKPRYALHEKLTEDQLQGFQSVGLPESSNVDCSISPTGLFAAVAVGALVYVIDTAASCVHSVLVHKAPVRCLAWHPQSALLAVATAVPVDMMAQTTTFFFWTQQRALCTVDEDATLGGPEKSSALLEATRIQWVPDTTTAGDDARRKGHSRVVFMDEVRCKSVLVSLTL